MYNQKVADILKSVLDSDYKIANKGETLYHCPFCNHRKKKLSVVLDENRKEFGFYKCWVCEKTGKNLFTLFNKIGGISDHWYEEIKEAVNKKDNFSLTKKKNTNETLTLPDSFTPLRESNNDYKAGLAAKYLERRGVSYFDVVRYNIGYCPDGKFANRIIIPSYNESSKLNYFVARDFYGKSNLKYLNPKASTNVVMFEDMLNMKEPVIITEGPFDAIACRRNATCVLGNQFQDVLLEKILYNNPPKVYLIPDPDSDAVSKFVEAAREIKGYGVSANLVYLDDEDPGDAGFGEIIKKINNSSEISFKEIIAQKLG